MQTTIHNDGVRLALGQRGSGPDVLFVHGLGSAQEMWDDVVAGLKDEYNCWTLDLRGHGASGRAAGGYNPEGYASDVAAAVDHIGRPTICVGHSLGGRSVVTVGAQGHPMVRAVYALDSTLVRAAGARTPSAGIFDRILKVVREYQSAGRPVDDYVDWLGAAPYVGGGTNREAFLPERLRGRAQSLSQVDPAAIEQTVNGHGGSALQVPALHVPFRLLGADPDLGASVKPEHEPVLRAHTPHIGIARLAGVGHQTVMIRGYAEQVLDDLQDWLAGLT